MLDGVLGVSAYIGIPGYFSCVSLDLPVLSSRVKYLGIRGLERSNLFFFPLFFLFFFFVSNLFFIIRFFFSVCVVLEVL